MAARRVYLDVYMGDAEKHAHEAASYQHTTAFLAKHATSYGLLSQPEALTDWEKETLQALHASLTSHESASPSESDEEELRFEPPVPLLAGRLVFALSASPKLTKTTNNFVALCTGEKGMCKSARNKTLHYLDCPFHRIVKGFVAQGGDVLRGDGSGGESIYGGDFKAEEEGLKTAPRRGSLGMASSKTGSSARNTSQFFVVLTDEESQLKKLKGQYVIFGELQGGPEATELLDRLSEVGGPNEKPLVPVWIGGCGTC